jgi:ferritin
MLTKEQLEKLNAQIHSEANVSRLYLSVSHWASSKGLSGVSAFFKAQHESEEEHMHKLESYILATGGRVKVNALETPPAEFDSVLSVLKMALDKEIEVSNNINELVHFFLESRNYSTFNFLQWFVAEQHEEENLFRGLIEKAELLSSEQNGGFWLDKELGELASSIKKI